MPKKREREREIVNEILVRRYPNRYGRKDRIRNQLIVLRNRNLDK